MKNSRDISLARTVAVAWEERQPTPEQRAVLYGIRTCLGLFRYKWPRDKERTYDLFHSICVNFRPHERRPYDFRHLLARSGVSKNAQDCTILRGMAARVIDEMTMPPIHGEVIKGMRIALAWAAELPQGHQALTQLLAEEEMARVVPPVTVGWNGEQN